MSRADEPGGEITAAQMAGYVETYSTKRRAIYRWVALGRAENDPPPLAKPAEMLGWWQRRMKQRPPAKILALAEKKSLPNATTPSERNASDTSSTDKKGGTSTPVDFSKLGDVTLEDAVRSLGMQLKAHQLALTQAMEEGSDSSTIQLKQRNVNVTLDLYRKCSDTLDEQRKGRGELIDIAELQEDWGALLGALAAMRERMMDDVEQELALCRDASGVSLPFTPDQIAAIRRAVGAVREREDALLRGAKHWGAGDAVQRTAA